jgi:siroheme synthase
MAAEARAGKKVVRLCGADVPIDTSDNEEVEALERAGIVLELVPGVLGTAGTEFSRSEIGYKP